MTSNRLDALNQLLFRPVAIDWLIVYRVSFGLVMLSYVVKYLSVGLVDLFYVWPIYHFPYDGFEWVSKSDLAFKFGDTMVHAIHLQYVAMGLLSIMIAAGFCFRISAVLFAICFTHVFLIDKCYYQNHYYLVSLLSCMLPFLPAHRAWSVDAWLWPAIRSQTVPIWTLWLLRFQIGVPYFFGGIAKLNADWIRGQPMRLALANKVNRPLIGGPWLTEEWVVQTVVWGGLLFDLLVVPALLYRRTRIWAFAACLFFHGMNALMWTIGIFPWMMMLATTIYFVPDWPRQLWSRLARKQVSVGAGELNQVIPVSIVRWGTVIALSLFVTWQVLYPFRHFMYPGNPSWNEYTHHFSWHMLLRAKETGLRIYATDPRTRRTGVIDLTHYVTARQLGVVGRDPRMIHQLCRHIHDDLEEKGFGDVEVRALALISMNGRKPQLIIDPNLDLAHLPVSQQFPEWIIPLHEPFRKIAWNEPISEWERLLQIKLPPLLRNEPQVASEELNATVPNQQMN